ncbi:hypothetical protein RB195_001265 [Necator americanus]|uniref:SCP-like protein n=1 Tax=Necator americanus TaxID=51031 RepID=A0ABR1DDG2_NECAM
MTSVSSVALTILSLLSIAALICGGETLPSACPDSKLDAKVRRRITEEVHKRMRDGQYDCELEKLALKYFDNKGHRNTLFHGRNITKRSFRRDLKSYNRALWFFQDAAGEWWKEFPEWYHRDNYGCYFVKRDTVIKVVCLFA